MIPYARDPMSGAEFGTLLEARVRFKGSLLTLGFPDLPPRGLHPAFPAAAMYTVRYTL